MNAITLVNQLGGLKKLLTPALTLGLGLGFAGNAKALMSETVSVDVYDLVCNYFDDGMYCNIQNNSQDSGKRITQLAFGDAFFADSSSGPDGWNTNETVNTDDSKKFTYTVADPDLYIGNRSDDVSVTFGPYNSHPLPAGLGSAPLDATVQVGIINDIDLFIANVPAPSAIAYGARMLNITRPTEGSLTTADGKINCGSAPEETDCSASIVYNTPVALSANPGSAYQFDFFTEDFIGETANPNNFNMTSDLSVGASFSLIQQTLRTLIVDRSMAGAIRSDDGGINCGSEALEDDCSEQYTDLTDVVLTAYPDAGFDSGTWTGDIDGEFFNPYTLTMDSDKNVGYAFNVILNPTYQVNFTQPTLGNITGSGINCGTEGSDCSEFYDDGTTQEFQLAYDANNASFNGWTGDATGTDNPLSVLIDADKNITAQLVDAQQREFSWELFMPVIQAGSTAKTR